MNTPIRTGREFTLPVLEARYDKAMESDTASDLSRLIAATELIHVLRLALHGSEVAA